MFKKCNYLLWALAAGLWCFAGNAHAAGEMSLTLDTMADSSNIQKYAGLTFLPDLKDSETGWAGEKIPGRAVTDNCKAYTKTSCGNNQDPAEFCPFDRRKFKTCYCSNKKYPYSASNCYKTGNASGSLAKGTECKQDGGGSFFPTCGCTESAYPYTNDASCKDDKKVVDDAAGCVIDKTQRYQACKCKAEYDKDSSWKSKNGYTCTSCSDSYGTKYKCVAKACPSGESTTKTTCTGKQVWKGTENYSGDAQCGKCSEAVNCGHFWNGNGAHSIPDSACSWDTYGHTATITVPSGKTYSSAWIRMWGDSSVVGDFTTGILTPGMVISNGGAYKDKRTITYKGWVTVTDKLRLEPGVTTVKFEKGVCGDFTCQAVSADNGANKWSILKDDIPQGSSYNGVTCPKKNSNCPTTGCSRYFINSDGNITIPNGQCAFDAYGHTANITTGTPKENGTYELAWIRMWGNSTVTNAFKTKELMSGIVVSNGGYYDDKRTYTYKGKVTVNGVIKTDPSVTTSVFQGGIEGDYTCESWTGTGGNNMKKVADIQPGQPGCPCSQSKYKYDSSNCSGTPTGESCGGKYTGCEEKSNAQKCLDEGYRLKEDWPKPTASNETVIPSSMLANFMKNIIELKSALAAPTLTTKIDEPDIIIDVAPITPDIPSDTEYQIIDKDATLVGDYTFTVTATCPYDSNYVKGTWKSNIIQVMCPVNCLTCSSETVCTKCKTGYSLLDGKCYNDSIQECNVSGCQTCVSGSTTKCAVCKSGYELSGYLCVRALNPGTGGGCNGTWKTCNGNEYCCPTGAKTPCDAGYSNTSMMCFMKAIDQATVE